MIKLSTRSLESVLTGPLESLGYRKNSVKGTGAALLYFKRDDELVLTLGIERSKLYAERFTGSFYFSPSYHWGFVPRGFPSRAMARIGRFLSLSERRLLLEDIYSKEEVVDAWWNGPGAAPSFVAAVEIAEQRFVEQPGLREQLRSAECLKEHLAMVYRVRALAETLERQPGGLSCQPKRLLSPVPEKWYWAAEVVVAAQRPENLKPAYVALLAVDAWRITSSRPGQL